MLYSNKHPVAPAKSTDKGLSQPVGQMPAHTPSDFVIQMQRTIGNRAVMQMFQNKTVPKITSAPTQTVQRMVDKDVLRKELEKRDISPWNTMEEAIEYISEYHAEIDDIKELIPKLDDEGYVLKSELVPSATAPKKNVTSATAPKKKKKKETNNPSKEEIASEPPKKVPGLDLGNKWKGTISDNVKSNKDVDELNESATPKVDSQAADIIKKFSNFKPGEGNHGGCYALGATKEDLQKVEDYAKSTNKWNVIDGQGDGKFSNYYQLKLIHKEVKSKDLEGQNVTFHISYQKLSS